METEFKLLVNKHKGLLFKVCNLYVHDPEDRKDLFQEILIQLWKSFHNFQNKSTLTTWIYKVALNTAISHFRKESRRPVSQSLSEMSIDIPDFQDDTTEQLGKMHEAILQLTEIERAIIFLYFEEKTYEEMAELLGIRTSHLGVKLNRIKQKISKIVKENT
ncbi:MAG: RNA polymerase sigma factor [Bacteroidota bacterium]